ncbi:MAG: DUF3182 family protein [Gluconacetobacter diazotrophicus]|nr:DUF3182 family protein [Gluconacetobacter diazotrophicus]
MPTDVALEACACLQPAPILALPALPSASLPSSPLPPPGPGGAVVPAPEPPLRGVAGLRDPSRPRANRHDDAARGVLLGRIAALLDLPLLDPLDADDARRHPLLLVPGEAIERPLAAAAGIDRPSRILGGIVPAAFVGTKAIAHGLVDPAAACPPDWSPLMAELTAGSVLRGYTAFTRADALLAGSRLLAHGPVRLKDVCGKAGLGQAVVRSGAELSAALALEDPDGLARCGLVLEEDLADVSTYSVGTTELGGRRISYWGQQNLTRDHQGREVYGGSDLFAVRGDLCDLLARDLPPVLAEAVRVAALFDAAARRCYPDLLLTRRNYDVIQGTDASGRSRIAVLEQSWRVGGASGAEIAAFEAFRAEPDTREVRCSTVERYDQVIPPAGATTYFCGDDPVVGPLTKFALRLG